MLGRFSQKLSSQRLLAGLLALVLVSSLASLASCGDRGAISKNFSAIQTSLAEVAPPEIISQLRQSVSQYQPRVKILSPKSEEIIKDTMVNAKFQVSGLPIFKDPELELGSHLNVTVDDRPYQEVYNLEEPLIIENLAPGTHTIRVLANTAWNESFKNEDAYAETTFHILTKSTENVIKQERSLITYNSPQGDYSAQPLLLDFYLKQQNKQKITDKVKVTINGQDFTLDKPESIYLKGFKTGKNWIKLELLDKDGNPVPNTYKDTLGVVNYQSGIDSPIAKLLESNLPASEALKVVDPKYKQEPIEVIEAPETTSDIEPSPILPEENKPIAPPVNIVPVLPVPPATPKTEISPEELTEESSKSEPVSLPKLELSPTPSVSPAPETQATPKNSFLDRFRRQVSTPAPVLATPVPTPEVVITPTPTPIPTPEIVVTPTPISIPKIVEPTPQPSPTSGFLQRFRRSVDESQPVTTPTPETQRLETTPTPTLQERLQKATETAPIPEVTATPGVESSTPAPNFLERFRQRSTPKAETTPATETAPIPEVTATPGVESSTPAPSFLERFRQRSTPKAEATPAPSLQERLQQRTYSDDVFNPVPQPSPVENKPEVVPSVPRWKPASESSSAKEAEKQTQIPNTQKDRAPDFLEKLLPKKTNLRLETEEGTTEVKAEKLPIIQASPETNLPSRYLRKSEPGED